MRRNDLPIEGAHAVDPEELLANAGWLRALARRLVGDGDAAEDVAQQAMVAAIEHPPRPGVPLRAWLARVARNLASNVRRAAQRRERHERAAAPAGTTSSSAAPDESVARAEMFDDLVHAVLALEPIHRDVVLLRFFDGHEMDEVARRLGVPVETARTRLKRALATLRDRLDARWGDRRAWVLLLGSGRDTWPVHDATRTSPRRPRVGGAFRPDPAGSPVAAAAARTGRAAAAAGGVLMAKKLSVAATALVLVALGVTSALVLSDGTGSGDGRDTVADAPSPETPRGRADAPVAPEPPAVADVEPARASCIVAVRDAPTGAAIPRALVFADLGEGEVAHVADDRGTVRIEVPAGASVRSVVAAAPGYTSNPAVRGASDAEHVASLWPSRLERTLLTVSGTVVAGDGSAVADLPVVGRESGGGTYVAVTDERGSFAFDVPWTTGQLLLAATDAKRGDALAIVKWAGIWDRVPPTELRLSGPRPVRVEVRWGQGSEPAGGAARVVATPVHTPRRPARTMSWTLPGTAAGTAATAATIAADIASTIASTMSVPIGMWRLDLRGDSGDVGLARPIVVLADAAGVRVCESGFRHTDGDCLYEPAGPAVETVVFDAAKSVLRFRVVDAASRTPVAGVRVVVEDAAEADAKPSIYEEMPDSIALQPSMYSTSSWDARRAPAELRVEAPTGADGSAELRGWVPLPAVVSVAGAFAVPMHRKLERADISDGPIELTATLGGRVSVSLPPFLDDCVLERMDVAELRLLTRDRSAATVPAGTYRVRQRRPAGHSPDEVVLAPPFDLAVGASRAVDLTGVRPKVTDVVRMQRLAAMRDACCRAAHYFGADESFRRMEGGEARFGLVRGGWTRRYELMWNDGRATHVHTVNVSGGEDATAPVVNTFEADYDAGTLVLAIDGLEPATSLVVTRTAVPSGAPATPTVDGHHVRVPFEAARDGEVRLSDLPAGEYALLVTGPTRRTCDEARRVHVAAGAVQRAEVKVEDLSLVVNFIDADAPATREYVYVRLLPEGSDDPRAAISNDDGWGGAASAAGPAEFRRVPLGRYRLQVRGMGPPTQRDGISYMASVVVHEEEVVVDGTVRRFDVRRDRR